MKLSSFLYFFCIACICNAQEVAAENGYWNIMTPLNYERDYPSSDMIEMVSAKVLSSDEVDGKYIKVQITLNNLSQNDIQFLGADSLVFVDFFEVLKFTNYEPLLNLQLKQTDANKNGELNFGRYGMLPTKYKFRYIGNYNDIDFANLRKMKFVVVPKSSTVQLECLLPKPQSDQANYLLELKGSYLAKKERYTVPERLAVSKGFRIVYYK